MNLFRPAVVLPLCASLGLHAAMGWSIGHHWASTASMNTDTIEISYSEPRTPVKLPVSQIAPPKKVRGIPVPRLPVQEEAVAAPEPSDFEKSMEAKLKQQQRVLAKLDRSTAALQARLPSAAAAPRSSAEILADPKKGKVFVEYFTEVRRKIQDTLSERYAHRYSVRGGVTVGFVLNSQGFLEKVAVLSRTGDEDARLEELALQCLKESAPFGAFPPELGSDRIAFNVTLYFVDR